MIFSSIYLREMGARSPETLGLSGCAINSCTYGTYGVHTPAKSPSHGDGQGTSQYYAARSQNVSNYRRTEDCPQNEQTFVKKELRLKAVHLKQDHQDWSYSKIGKKIGCSHKFVSRWVARHQQGKGVSDHQRSGRHLKADADAPEYTNMAAQLPECSSAADVAAKPQQAKGLKMSPSSITRLLRRKGLQHITAKVVPMLKASQKLARVTYAKAALRIPATAIGICDVQHVCISQCDYTECCARPCMQHDSPYCQHDCMCMTQCKTSESL